MDRGFAHASTVSHVMYELPRRRGRTPTAGEPWHIAPSAGEAAVSAGVRVADPDLVVAG